MAVLIATPDESVAVIDSMYDPAATALDTFKVTVPVDAVEVSNVIPELDGVDM